MSCVWGSLLLLHNTMGWSFGRKMDESKVKFRNSTNLVWSIAGIILFAIMLAADKNCIPALPRGDSGGRLAVYVGGIIFSSMGIRPLIVATPRFLIVRNPLKTYRIPWSEIKGFQAEMRVIVELNNGSEVSCLAVNRTNLARMLNRRSHVDNVVADLEELRTVYLGDGKSS